MDTHIRKQVEELTSGDLALFPLWEYAWDEVDLFVHAEGTVRPVEPSAVTAWAESSYLVRASFTLADGTSLPGLLTVHGTSTVGNFPIEGDEDLNSRRRPVILASQGQVVFWFGAMKPPDREIRKSYRILGGKSDSEVFPILYSTDTDFPEGPVQGRVAGFFYLEQKDGSLDFVVRSVT